MAGEKSTSLVPKLRFPEFADDRNWDSKPLHRLAMRRTQRNVAGSKLRSLTNSAEFGVVDQRDYFHKDIATNTDNYFVVETGDFVYNPRVSSIAPVGPISKNLIGAGVMSPLYSVFRFKNDEHDFFSHFFASSHWHQYLRKVSNSGARHDRMAISNDDLMSMPIPLPPTEDEQQKVANCLGSLDDLIAAESRKLDALRKHKKGLMQQLFPQPGKTVPRLRFPDFRDSGEWVPKLLGKIANISKGKGIAKADITPTGRIPCVRYGELYTLYGEIIDSVESRTNVPAKDLVLSRPGDVIVPASGETKEDIATCACVIDGGVALGGDLNVIRTELDGRFLSFYLNGAKRGELAKIAQGDTVAHIYPKQLSGIKVLIPKSEGEQKRIAECLGSFNPQLHSHSERIDALKHHKRGLLQQLFPSLEGNER